MFIQMQKRVSQTCANPDVWEWCSAQAIADSGKARANAGWGQTIKYKMIEIKFEQNKQKTT